MKDSKKRFKYPQDIYARNLISHRGYPLWTPELKAQLPPDYQDDGLKIGDVGYVVPSKGFFEVFFNILLPLDHDLHRAKRLPKNFQPISQGQDQVIDIGSFPDAEDAGSVFMSSSVKSVEATPDEQPSNYKFALSPSEGALLILPEGADQHLLGNDRLFGEYAKEHAAEWYRFVEKDLKRTIAHDSLYLITGFYKAPSFALACFPEIEASEDDPAQFKITTLEKGCIAGKCRWSTTRPQLEKRVGPGKKIYNGKANQAVYISGFKIAVRPEPAGKKRVSVKADDPSAQPRHEEFTDVVDSQDTDEVENDKFTEANSTTQGCSTSRGARYTSEQILLQHVPDLSQPFHPSDTINRYLLRKEPAATTAITHDNQWITLLKNGRLETRDLADEHLLVKALSEEHTITSQDGNVFFRSEKGVMSTSNADESGADNRAPQPESDTQFQPLDKCSLSTKKVGTHRPSDKKGKRRAVSRTSPPFTFDPKYMTDEDHSDLFIPSGKVSHSIPISTTTHVRDQFSTAEPTVRFGIAISDLTSNISKVPVRFQEVGTFCDVYMCQYNTNSGPREVALKVFRSKVAPNDRADYKLLEERLRRAAIWRMLQHTNVVPLLGIANSFGRSGPSLVSPRMRNGCLQQFLEHHEEKLSSAHRVCILRDIINGLHYLHTFSSSQIVHGNLDPTNILLDEKYTARLAGFGNSSIIYDLPNLSLAYPGTVMSPSSVRWASPEHILNVSDTLKLTTKSDIYSFGSIALQTLTGKRPWSWVREDAAIVLLLVKEKQPAHLDSVRLNERQRELIRQCWQPVQDRPSSEALVNTIWYLLSDHPLPPPLCDVIEPISDRVDTEMCSLVPDPLVAVDDIITDIEDHEAFSIASGSGT